MALIFKFDIQEAPDAKSFILYDKTGEYNVTTNPGGWGGGNAEKISVTAAYINVKNWKTPGVIDTYTITAPVIDWENGVELTKLEGIFDDGVYEMEVFLNNVAEAVMNVGFAAIVKSDTMKQCLSYSPIADRRLKDLIEEKMRLLNNLYYSADTNQIDHFLDNLTALQKLK